MSYVVYNSRTWTILNKADGGRAIFDSERAAKAFRTRYINHFSPNTAGEIDFGNPTIDTISDYYAKEPMVETYNLMDPDRKPIKIRLSEKGTCCDPATETYHCM